MPDTSRDETPFVDFLNVEIDVMDTMIEECNSQQEELGKQLGRLKLLKHSLNIALLNCNHPTEKES